MKQGDRLVSCLKFVIAKMLKGSKTGTSGVIFVLLYWRHLKRTVAEECCLIT